MTADLGRVQDANLSILLLRVLVGSTCRVSSPTGCISSSFLDVQIALLTLSVSVPSNACLLTFTRRQRSYRQVFTEADQMQNLRGKYEYFYVFNNRLFVLLYAAVADTDGDPSSEQL